MFLYGGMQSKIDLNLGYYQHTEINNILCCILYVSKTSSLAMWYY